MKKIILLLAALTILISGCSGFNTSTVTNVTVDTTFLLMLKNNPTYKPIVTKALTDIKAILNKEINYDTLIAEINNKLPLEYSAIAGLLIAYIGEDKPVFETYVNLLDSYKKDISLKLDHFITLAKL